MRRALLVFSLGLLGAAGCGSGHAGVVPWVNRTLPLYEAPSPKLIRYPTTAPLCRAGALRVTAGRGGAATGHELRELVFTNTGARTCLLRGYPAISALTPAGRRTTLHPHHGTFFEPLLAADVAPGGHALLEVETDDMCVPVGLPPVTRYRDLVFALPWGGSVSGGRLVIAKECGLDISELGLEARYGPLPARPGTVGTLRAAVHLVTKLRAGSNELGFTVTLDNPTATVVRLSPCPGYTEGLDAGRLFAHDSFALDCDSVHAIPAHGHVRFAMRLALPCPLPATPVPAKLSWSLDTPNGPFAGRALVVAK